MSVLILDGVSASGKSMFLTNIQKRLLSERQNFSKVIITEHLTERYFEDKEISVDTVHDHVTDLLGAIRNISGFQNNSRFKGNTKVVSVIVERLFLTLMSRSLLKFSFFEEKSSWLTELDLHSVLLYVPDECFKARLESTIDLRNEAWKGHIASLGGLEKAILHFIAQQEAMVTINAQLSKYMRTSLIEVYDVNDIPTSGILDLQ